MTKLGNGSVKTSKQEIADLIESLSDRPWPEGFEEARIHYDSLGTPIADDIHVEKLIIDGVAAQMLIPPQCDDARVMIYVHGGGYVVGSLISHGGMVAEIARNAKCKVLQLDYLRAPEHKFPAPVEDTCKAYHWLLKKGYEAKKITIAGDSAGGGLVVATLVALQNEGTTLPGAIVCIAPWVDLEFTGESYEARKEIDPFVQREVAENMRELYLGNQDPKDPIASPINADLTGFPAMLIQVGEREILFSDSEMLANKAKASGVDVTFEEWPEMVHVWHFYYPVVSDGMKAIARIGEFVIEKTA